MEKLDNRYNCIDCGKVYVMSGDSSLDANVGLCLECGAAKELEKIDARRA